VPAVHAETGADRRLFWEHEGNAAVSDGDTKLIRLGRDAIPQSGYRGSQSAESPK
jgi:hypothetical protein